MKNHLTINLPKPSKICMWNKSNNFGTIIKINIHNKTYNFYIPEKIKRNFFFDKWSNSIIINKKGTNNSIKKTEQVFNKFLKSINIYYYSKIKFKGKGFRIKFLKKNKLIKFFFGRSHITFIFLKKILKKRLNKYKFVLRTINKNCLNIITKKITNIKKFNIYTLRGIRSSKQKIYKRKGKKGTYI